MALKYQTEQKEPNINEANKQKFPMDKLPKNDCFTGRTAELRKIARELCKDSTLVIVGEGGFGKSQLAFEYARRHSSDYDCIWLVNAANEKRIKESYEKFANHTGLCSAEKEDFKKVLDHVIRWLEKHDRYLFIYDNAEGLSDNLKNYLPQVQVCGHILISTRDRECKLGTTLDVETFSKFDGVAFLKKCREKYKINIKDENAHKLAEKLKNFPLALDQAVAYMRFAHVDCATYMKEYDDVNRKVSNYVSIKNDNKNKLLNPQFYSTPAYEQMIETTLQLITNIIPENARQLFKICTYFAPDYIPLAMLLNGHYPMLKPLHDDLEPADERITLLKNLVRYSLLRLDSDEDLKTLLTIHRLTQQAARCILDLLRNYHFFEVTDAANQVKP